MVKWTRRRLPLISCALLWLAAAGHAPAVVTTLAPSGVTPYQATLNGSASAGDAGTRVWFAYGLTTSYGNTSTSVVLSAPFPSGAVSFNGTNQNATAPGFANFAPTIEITIEFWQKAAASKQQSTFILNDDEPTNRINTHVPWTDGNVYWDFGNIGGAGRLSYPDNGLFGVWNHIALVASQSGNAMRIYRNGALVAQKSGMSGFQRYAGDLLIGGGTDEGLYFNGAVSEFRVWNKALDQATIQSWMGRSLNNTHPAWTNLTAYWPMNEGSGAILNDHSGNGRTAFLTNSPAWLSMSNPAIAISIQGLTPNTTYHYAMVVGGTTVGPDGTFTTPAATNLNGSLPLTVLHHFTGSSDNELPICTPVVSGKRLYGTTSQGGGLVFGSVFAVNTDGTGFTNLHLFGVDAQGNPVATDGQTPPAGLVLSGDTLYGTATYGGSNYYGTIFSVKTNGTAYTNLYNFTSGNDGGYPITPLLLSGRRLYGACNGGGTNGYGTIFAVNTDGSGFATLHHFATSDGYYSVGTLALSGGTLFGAMDSGASAGNGTIFSLGTNGAGFTLLHTFSSLFGVAETNSDGASPADGVVVSGNALYGTASSGGNYGAGVVFSVNTNGSNFAVLYHFTGGADGSQPRGLVQSGRTLYVTLGSGSAGLGALFRINTNGTGTAVLHDFSPQSYNPINGYTNNDGIAPSAPLTLVGNTLYGSAYSGGAYNEGTIFSLALGPDLQINRVETNVVLDWSTNFGGYNLQSTTNLAGPHVWTPVSPLPSVAGAQFTVTNAMSSRPAFYRLSQ